MGRARRGAGGPAREAAPLSWGGRFVVALTGLAVVGAAWLGGSYLRLPTVQRLTALEKTPPERSALMRARVEEADDDGRPLTLRHAYVPLSRIAMPLQRAVVLAEDQRFWRHEGIDWGETRALVEKAFAERKLGRGGSTITQQLAKNLYLSEERSLVRKAWEGLVASRLEEALTKRRILELYLNFAEWGDGIFGAEAAARAYFRKSAAQLDAAEAAVLTAMLPSPRTRHPGRPTPNLRRRAWIVWRLMQDVEATAGASEERLRAIVGGMPQRSRKDAPAHDD